MPSACIDKYIYIYPCTSGQGREGEPALASVDVLGLPHRRAVRGGRRLLEGVAQRLHGRDVGGEADDHDGEPEGYDGGAGGHRAPAQLAPHRRHVQPGRHDEGDDGEGDGPEQGDHVAEVGEQDGHRARAKDRERLEAGPAVRRGLLVGGAGVGWGGGVSDQRKHRTSQTPGVKAHAWTSHTHTKTSAQGQSRTPGGAHTCSTDRPEAAGRRVRTSSVSSTAPAARRNSGCSENILSTCPAVTPSRRRPRRLAGSRLTQEEEVCATVGGDLTISRERARVDAEKAPKKLPHTQMIHPAYAGMMPQVEGGQRNKSHMPRGHKLKREGERDDEAEQALDQDAPHPLICKNTLVRETHLAGPCNVKP